MSGIATNCSVNPASRALENKEGAEVISKLRLNRLITHGDFILSTTFTDVLFNKGWSINDLSKAGKQKALYHEMRLQLQRDYKNRKASLSPRAVAELQTIFVNWNAFAKYHSEASGLLVNTTPPGAMDDDSFVDTVDANPTEIDDPEIEATVTDYERAGNNKSTYELAENDVRTLFRMIPKESYNEQTGKNEEVIDEDGLPVMSDSSTMFKLFSNELAGINSNEEFKAKLTSPRILRQFPEVGRLERLLGINTQEKDREQLQTLYKFYNLFTRPRVEIYMGTARVQNGKTSFTFDKTVKNTLNKIESRFRNNFLLNNMDDAILSNYTEIDRDLNKAGDQIGYGRRRITSVPDELPGVDFNRIADPKLNVDLNVALKADLDFLQLLGVKFSGLNLLEPHEKEAYARDIHKIAAELHTSVSARLVKGQRIYDPMKDLRQPFSTIASDSKHVRKLAQLEARYSRELPSLSNRNAKGETQYSISDHNHLTVSVAYINQAKSLKELYEFAPYRNLKYNPLIGNSALRDFLFDKSGKKINGRSISISNKNGFQKEAVLGTKNKTTNKTTADLSARDKFIFDFNAFAIDNVLEMMRTESKSSFFFFHLNDGNDHVPYIAHNSFLKSFTEGPFGDKMVGYLDGEIARVKSYDEKRKELPTLPPTYGQFSILSFLPTEYQTKLKTDGYKYDRAEFLGHVDNYFNKKLVELREFAIKENIKGMDLFHPNAHYATEGEVNDAVKESLMRSYIANTYVNDVEQTIFLTGDPLFAAKMKNGVITSDFHKRLGGVISSGRLTNINPEYQTWKTTNLDEQAFSKKYSLSSILGVKERDNTHTYLSAVIPDIETSDNDYSKEEEVIAGMKASYKLREGKDLSTEEVKKLIGDPKVTVTDGAAYTHLDFWRESGIKMGWWTDEAETAYMYESLIFKEDNSKLTDEDKAVFSKLQAMIYKNPKMYGIPMGKYTYFGPIINSTVDAKRFDKFAVKPILPSEARGNPALAKINKDMIAQQLGYVTHKSGTKMFYTKIIDDLGAMKKGDADVLSTQLFKEQIKTHTETGTETTLLTQFVSLLFTNLFNNGVAASPAIQTMFDKYKGIFKDMHTDFRQAVQSVGIKLDKDNNPIGFEPKKLIEKIQEQVGNRDYNSNILGALTLEEGINQVTGKKEYKLKYPIEQSGIVSQVQDYVLGFLDKKLRRYKINGTDHVVTTPGYYEEKLKFSKYNPNGTDKMECRVTFSESHLPLLDFEYNGTKIGTVANLNKLLKDKEFVQKYEKFLTVTFGRAPIDSPHSMGVAIVKQFFEPTSGSVLQLPEEFIKASGIDFDIDKEKVYFPYMTDIKIDNVRKEIGQMEKKYKELRNYSANYMDEEGISKETKEDNIFITLFEKRKELNPNEDVYEMDNEIYEAYKRFDRLKRMEAEYKVNELLQMFEDALRLPELYIDTVLPNTADDVNKIAEDNGAATGTSNAIPALAEVLDAKQNLNVFSMFMSAKRLLSIFAKGNTQYEFLKQAGARINQNYNFYEDEKTGEWKPAKIIHPSLLTKQEEPKVFNDGKIWIGNKYDVKGRVRQWFQAQKLTSTLDSAKDPRFADLNLNMKNTGVAEMLDSIGVPFERVIDFLNIPVIQRYSVLRDRGVSKRDAIHQMLDHMEAYTYDVEPKTAENAEYQADRKKGLIVGPFTWDKATKIYSYNVRVAKPMDHKILNQINLRKPIENELMKDMTFDKQFGDDRVAELKVSKDYKLGGKDFEDTLQLLSYYSSLEEHQWELFSLKRLYDNVSKKIGSTLDIHEVAERKAKLLNTGFVDQSELDLMDARAFPVVFNQDSFIEKTMELIFPVISTPVISRGFKQVMTDFIMQGATAVSERRKLPKVILDDFIYSIMTNFGEYKGQKFIEYGKKLIGKNEDNSVVADRIGTMRKRAYWNRLTTDFPVLANFNPLPATETNSLYSMPNKEGKLIKSIPYNIEFVDNFDMTETQEEDFIQQIKTLISDDFYFEADPAKGKEANEKESKYISGLMKDILLTSLTQAGVSNGRLSYYKLIPPQFTQAILQPAFEKFLALNKEEKRRYMAQFTGGAGNIKSKFKIANPRFFKMSNEETWRGKNYIFDMDLISPPVTNPDDIYSQLGSKTVSGNVVIKPWSELREATKAISNFNNQVISTRIPKTEEHFGNPFSHDPTAKTVGLIKTETVKEAVEKYIDWVINSEDKRAAWIREQLKSGELKNKPILYYKELGEPSHATALDYLINKYDWTTEPSTELLQEPTIVGEPEVNIQTGQPEKVEEPEVTPAPKPEPIDDDMSKYELFPGVYANEGQKKGLDLLRAYLKGDKKEFTLIGRGGTGKTTIIKKILQDLEGKKVGGITVAHKAKKVLGKSIGKDKVMTIASALSIKLDESTGKFTPDEFKRKKGQIPINKLDVIIVDEASMVSPAMYKEIMQLKKPSAKVIFMGDNAQLPPIGEAKDSPVFDIEGKYELREKMRQAQTSPIIGVGTIVADNIETVEPKLIAIRDEDRISRVDEISKSAIIYTPNEDKALNSLVADFKKGNNNPDFVKAVTFNNENHDAAQSVKNLNLKIRAKLWGANAANQFNVGELVTAYDSYAPIKDEEPVIHNSDDFIIKDIKEKNKVRGSVSVYSAKMGARSFTYEYDLLDLQLADSEGQLIEGETVPVVAASSLAKFNDDLTKLWKTDMQMAFALKGKFANLQYGYAITSHKAQGSTYTNTYVFEDNILGRTNGGDAITKNKSLYVAVSRPTTKLVMISDRNVNPPSQEVINFLTESIKPVGKPEINVKKDCA